MRLSFRRPRAALPALVLTALAYAASGGCAAMSVEVEVLDATFLEDPKVVDAQMRRTTLDQEAQIRRRLRSGRFDRETAKLAADIAAALGELNALGGVTAADAAVMRQNLTANFRQRVDGIRQRYDTGIRLVQGSRRMRERPARMDALREAADAFAEGAELLGELETAARQQRDALSDAARRRIATGGTTQPSAAAVAAAARRNQAAFAQVAAADAKATESIEKLRRSIIPGVGLFDDPIVSLVVHAPDNYWRNGEEDAFRSWRRNRRRSLFNDTRASGQFGNSDIAIKMEYDLPGNFTIKGMRLDARKVTEATFKALRMSIELAAMMYGIPVPKATPEGTADRLQAASADFATAEDGRREAEQQRREARVATVSILNTIVAEAAALADEARVVSASGNVRSVYAAYRPRLQPPAAATPAAGETPTP
jgi:hypothetical protein